MSESAKIEVFSAGANVEVEIKRGGRCTTIRLSVAEARSLSDALRVAADVSTHGHAAGRA